MGISIDKRNSHSLGGLSGNVGETDKFIETTAKAKKQAEEKQVTQKVVVAEQEEQQLKVQFQAVVEKTKKLITAEKIGREESEEKGEEIANQTVVARNDQNAAKTDYDAVLKELAAEQKKQKEAEDKAVAEAKAKALADKKAAVVKNFDKKLDELYKNPVKSADGRNVKIQARVERADDGNTQSLKSILRTPKDNVTEEHQVVNIHLQQVDSDPNVKPTNLGSFRATLNGEGEVLAFEMPDIYSLDLNAGVAWSDNKTDCWAEAFRIIGAKKGPIELVIADQASMTPEFEAGVISACKQAGIDPSRVSVHCGDRVFKFNGKDNKLMDAASMDELSSDGRREINPENSALLGSSTSTSASSVSTDFSHLNLPTKKKEDANNNSVDATIKPLIDPSADAGVMKKRNESSEHKIEQKEETTDLLPIAQEIPTALAVPLPDSKSGLFPKAEVQVVVPSAYGVVMENIDGFSDGGNSTDPPPSAPYEEDVQEGGNSNDPLPSAPSWQDVYGDDGDCPQTDSCEGERQSWIVDANAEMATVKPDSESVTRPESKLDEGEDQDVSNINNGPG